MSAWQCRGFAPGPTMRLCLLDLQQRARPFAICPLNGSKGLCPLAEFQEAEPLGGFEGGALA